MKPETVNYFFPLRTYKDDSGIIAVGVVARHNLLPIGTYVYREPQNKTVGRIIQRIDADLKNANPSSVLVSLIADSEGTLIDPSRHENATFNLLDLMPLLDEQIEALEAAIAAQTD